MKLSDARPIGSPDQETGPFWDATRESRLVVQRCGDCDHAQLYPRAVCTACFGENLSWHAASGRGVVHSHTTVFRPPHPSFTPPYVVALVRLDEGPIVMTNIIGCETDQVRCEMPVHVAWEDLPDGRRLPLFKPEAGG